jgi:ribosomal protein S12 methylthiotransferase accessory factor
MWPFIDDLGITRLARQTGLDRVGLPCWAAIRPNSLNLSTAQGKGLTDAAACASALMEAVEIAVAEQPHAPRRYTSGRKLTQEGFAWLNPDRLLPEDTPFDSTREITWVRGSTLAGGIAVWVPLDAVDMAGPRAELRGICKTSNGLASGNTYEEALFHGLCELIERDGTAHWSFKPEDEALLTAFSPASLNDPLIDNLVAQIEDAGLKLTLFDQTSDLRVPVVMAVIGPADARASRSLEYAAGYGAHPVAARAALRAITEAAQSRVTSIAAARDDIDRHRFLTEGDAMERRLLEAPSPSTPPRGLPIHTVLPALLDEVTAAFAEHEYDVVVVSLAEPDLPCVVLKVLCPELEDRGANLNWRPGRRYEKAFGQ